MSATYRMQLICERMHLTTTELINPRVLPDGSLEASFSSDAHYCSEGGDKCGELTDMGIELEE